MKSIMTKSNRASVVVAPLLAGAMLGTAACTTAESTPPGCTLAACTDECLDAGYSSALCVMDLCQCSGRVDGGADTDDVPAEADGEDGGATACPTTTEAELLAACTGHDICLLGRFTIDTNPDDVAGTPSTDAFDGLEGVANLFVLAGDGGDYFTNPSGSDGWRGSLSVFDMTGAGEAVCGQLIPALQGRPFSLFRDPSVEFDTVSVVSASGSESWAIVWNGELSEQTDYRPFELTGTLMLEHTLDGAVTDRATGSCVLVSR
jgi:hypothetical protein